MRGIAFFLSRGAEGSGASLAGRAERRLGEMAEQPKQSGGGEAPPDTLVLWHKQLGR